MALMPCGREDNRGSGGK